MTNSMGRLSKSTFLSGLQCEKRLWLELHKPEVLEELSSSQEQLLEQGQLVGTYARDCFPEGVLIESHGNSAIVETRKAIKDQTPMLFEAAFESDGLFIRCDILERTPQNAWQLIEVKSTTKFDSNLHIPDIAVQWFVLEQNHIPIESVNLMYINTKDCVYPDLSNLFVVEDVTHEVALFKASLPEKLSLFQNVLSGSEPEKPIGYHCSHPHHCPVKPMCWAHVPEKSIFTIPRLHRTKSQKLIEENCLAIHDLPDDFPLTETQQRYVQSVKTNRVEINKTQISTELSQLAYPLYFFDFETFNPPIPRFDGMRPYQQFPFQYSCHVLDKNGERTHKAYLHRDESDPRLPLTKSLMSDIESQGSIVVYNASFERRVLNELMDAMPQYAEALSGMIDRLWDQMLVFKNHYMHPDFLGSASIKNVLPVLVPELSYNQLAVKKGDEAQAIWDQMIREKNVNQKLALESALKDYCKMDTFAMVRIHQVLSSL